MSFKKTKIGEKVKYVYVHEWLMRSFAHCIPTDPVVQTEIYLWVLSLGDPDHPQEFVDVVSRVADKSAKNH